MELKESISNIVDGVFHRYEMNKAFYSGISLLEEEVPFTSKSLKLMNIVYRYGKLLPGTFGSDHYSIVEVESDLKKLKILRKRINNTSKKLYGG